MPVFAAGSLYQASPLGFSGDMGQGIRQGDAVRPDAQQQLADIPHPVGAHGILTEADFLPLSVRIDAAAGDGDVEMRVPVESSSVRTYGWRRKYRYPGPFCRRRTGDYRRRGGRGR